MPGMLTRSKSLRFLRNNRRDATEQVNGDSMPPAKGPQTDFDKYKATTSDSRKEGSLGVPDVAKRPSTSGGPGEHPFMFHKKTNPAPSIYSQDHIHSFQSPTSSTTVLYSPDTTKEQGVIGIALGSPTSSSHWKTTSQAVIPTVDSKYPDSPMAALSQPNGSSVSLAGRPEASKSKLSRWKSLFRKAPPPQAEKPSFYQLAQTVTAAPRADSHHDEEALEPQTLRPEEKEREKLRSVSPPTYRPNIRASRKWGPGEFVAPQSPPETAATRERALTLGSDPSHGPEKSVQRAFTTPDLGARGISGDVPPVPQVEALRASSKALPHDSPTSVGDGGPLLDVSLPDATIERYSVMFGNLLHSDPSRSSLLARRQGNAEKVKPLQELSAKDDQRDETPVDYSLQRRVTSPTSASGSPRLSLFPSTNPNRAPSPLSGSIMNRSRKDLKRSRTMPTKTPLQQTFAENAEIPAAPIDSATPKSVALTPTSICSFESEAESITIIVAQSSPGRSKPIKLHLDEREPEWEICSKPIKAAKSEILPIKSVPNSPLIRSPSQKQPKVTKLSALSSHPSSAPLDAPSPLQRLQSLSTPPHSASRLGEKRAEIQARRREGRTEEVVAAKAMVGIARSVSVSRANSPRAVVRTMTSPHENRIVDRLALTPTMVEVRNRKSQRVQLEDA
ncbi:hypothetical protein G6011_10647 [Alternaria panax]|uniref:Uncharacterized protein n=1 Tax=Alternaria panax TaxID=48097 RepID=A0AAD4IC07_9PLEO|nr:hypothetical protein G6011_10647 [Alternaria panax]